MVDKLTRKPFKDSFEFRGFQIIFEAMKVDPPKPEIDWWILEKVNRETRGQLSTFTQLEFEIDNHWELNDKIQDICREAEREAEYERTVSNVD